MNLRRALWAAALVAVICCMGLPTAVWAGTTTATGLAQSPHDFTSYSGTTNPVGSTLTVQIGLCSLCHTPHYASQTHLLWNHTLSTNSFSWGGLTSTTAGTQLPTNALNTYQGSSAKCLSCHDGSVAPGSVVAFENNSTHANAGNVSSAGPLTGSLDVAPLGSMTATHPIAIAYPYNGVANTYNNTTTGNGYTGGLPAGWYNEWVKAPAYPILLFNDNGSGVITAGPAANKSGIECSSCHDVHNKEDVADALNTVDAWNYLLRGTITGDTSAYICQGCHNK